MRGFVAGEAEFRVNGPRGQHARELFLACVAGEITTETYVPIGDIVRQTIDRIEPLVPKVE